MEAEGGGLLILPTLSLLAAVHVFCWSYNLSVVQE